MDAYVLLSVERKTIIYKINMCYIYGMLFMGYFNGQIMDIYIYMARERKKE